MLGQTQLKDDPQGRTFWDVKHTEEERHVTFAIAPGTVYDRVHAAMDRLARLVEPYPGIATQQPRPINEVEADLEALKERGEIDAKLERLHWLMNAIVRASLYRYNREERRTLLKPWHGSVAIDGTLVPIYSTKFGGGVRKEYRNCNSTKIHHPEAMAGWYVRTGDHGGFQEDGVTPVSAQEMKDSKWGLEAHFAITIDDEHANKAHHSPNLVFGVALGAPGARIGENSLIALKSLHKVATDNNIGSGTLVGDRAVMPNAKADKLKKPARKLGFNFCHDYTSTQLGKQQGPIGAVQVEGQLYCPAITNAMANATKKARGRQDTEDDDFDAVEPDRTYKQQLERRHLYIVPTKEPLNANGEIRISCPASDPRGGVSCPLRKAVVEEIKDADLRNKLTDRMKDGKTRASITNPPAYPNEICTSHQLSHKVQLDDKALKYHQDYAYKSPTWYKMYGQRNQVETFNKDVKDDGLGDTKRRRMRGYGKQGILIALFVARTNVKRINAYLAVWRAKIQTVPKDPGPSGRPGRGHGSAIVTEDLPPPDRVAA